MHRCFKAVCSTYRTYLRHVKQLPHFHLSLFFRIKASDDFRRIAQTADSTLRLRKLKRVSKDLELVRGAVEGKAQAFKKLLDVVYGRQGKLKWELMQPFLTCPHSPKGPRLISTVPKSQLPVFSDELKALLTSSYSRTTKPLAKSALARPHGLPARADPKSSDARNYGRLSKRRELKIRWRQFKTEWQKVLPPLQVRDDERGRQLKSLDLMHDIETLARSPCSNARTPPLQPTTASSQDQPSLRRWYRRRYQELLGRIPTLENKSKLSEGRQHYVPSLSNSAVSSHIRWSYHGSPEVDSDDIAWLQRPLPNLQKKSQIQKEIRATSNWLYENIRV